MCVGNRFDDNDHLTDKERDKTQIKRKIILLVKFKLMKKIFQRIQSSQRWIADFFIKFKKPAEKENGYQSHRSNQDFDIKFKSERYRKKPY